MDITLMDDARIVQFRQEAQLLSLRPFVKAPSTEDDGSLPGTVVVEHVPFRHDFYREYFKERRDRNKCNAIALTLTVVWLVPILSLALNAGSTIAFFIGSNCILFLVSARLLRLSFGRISS